MIVYGNLINLLWQFFILSCFQKKGEERKIREKRFSQVHHTNIYFFFTFTSNQNYFYTLKMYFISLEIQNKLALSHALRTCDVTLLFIYFEFNIIFQFEFTFFFFFFFVFWRNQTPSLGLYCNRMLMNIKTDQLGNI